MNKRFVTFLLLGLIFVGLTEWDLEKRILSPIREFDRFWVDFCIGNAGDKIGNPSITMVRIPDDYEPLAVGVDNAAAEGSKNLSRLDYAAFLYAIGQMNPRTVSFLPTPVFADRSVLNKTSIFPLKDAVLQLPRMTLAASVSNQELASPTNVFRGILVKGDTGNIPEISKISLPLDSDFLINGDPAFVQSDSFLPINEGSPRIQLVARYGDQVVPGFVLASVAKQAGVRPKHIILDLEKRRPTIQVGEYFTIPVGIDGAMELPSHGGLSHSMYDVRTDANGKTKRTYHFASLTVEDVALAANQEDSVAQSILDEFAGKYDSISRNLVILGSDRTSDRTIKTANNEWLSPMTAYARAIATIQSGRYVNRWSFGLRCAVYLGIFLLGFFLLGMSKKSLPLIIGIGAVLVIAMVLVFKQTLTWTPPTANIGLSVIMFLVALFSKNSKAGQNEETGSQEA